MNIKKLRNIPLDKWKVIEKDTVNEYIKKETCFNCGGHDIKYVREIDDLNNSRLLIVCQECGKTIICDCMDGIKM